MDDNQLDVSRIPTNFYELELRNPKRNTGFAVLGKNLLDNNPERHVPKLDLELRMIEKDEEDTQKELKIYQRLLKGMGMKVHNHLIHNHAYAAKDTDQDYYQSHEQELGMGKPGSSRRQNFPYNNLNYSAIDNNPLAQSQQQPQNLPPLPNPPVVQETPYVQKQVPAAIQPERTDHSPEPRPQQHQSMHKNQSAGRITIEKLPQKRRINSAVTTHSRGVTSKPIDVFQQALDNYVYDKYDNDVNRRANKAHNLSTHIRFLGAGAPMNNPELDKLKDIQKKMTYKQMLEEQIQAKNKEAELRRLKLKEEDLKDLERIRKENEEMELRMLNEDGHIKDREKRMREFNSKLSMQNSGGAVLDNLNTVRSTAHARGKNDPNLARNLSTIHEAQYTQQERTRQVEGAKQDMEHYKMKVKRDLESELRREREFLEQLPDEIRRRIQSTMNVELQRLKNEVNKGSNVLRDEILRLRAQAVELDDEKRKASKDLHKLRERLAKVQYQDDIRTHELLNALAEDNLYKILPSSSRFTMPEALFKDDERNEFPISYYNKDRVIKGEAKLYSDGYFSNDARMTSDPLYKSLNFDIGGGVKKVVSSFENGIDYETERVMQRNNERDNVFSSVLDGDKAWELEDYLRRDLEDPINVSF